MKIAKPSKPKPGQNNKDDLHNILVSFFGPGVAVEYRFHPVRMWRFDYAVESLKIAVEYHGHAGFIGGKASGHSTIKGLSNDCEKLNSAARLGWRVIAFTALHFDAKKRDVHKLTAPYETIRDLAGKAPAQTLPTQPTLF